MSSADSRTWVRPETLLNFGSRRRLPVILQAESTECSLACLAMVASYYGYDTDLISLRQRFSVSSHGTNLKALINIAGRIHLSGRALRLEVEQIEQLQVPAILHWNLNHFVVLKEVRRNDIVVHDPAAGERRLDRAEFSRHFSGVALELTPTPEFEAGEVKQSMKLSQLWSRMTGFKRSLAQVLTLALLLQMMAIISPYYVQMVVDDVVLRNDESLLTALAIGFGLLLAVQIGTSSLRELVILHLSSRLTMQMSANLFRHLVRLPMDYFYKRHMGDILSRFGALGPIQSMLTAGVISTIVDGLLVVVTLAVMFMYSVRLTAIVVVAVGLYAALRLILYRPLRLLTEEQIVAKAKLDSHFMESIRAVQAIKLFQRENERQGQWQNYMADFMNRGIRIAKWGIGYNVLNGAITGLGNIIVIYFAAQAIMGNVITIGMFYAFMSYKGRFESSIVGLIGRWIEFRMLGLYLERAADIAFTTPEPVDQHSSQDFHDRSRSTGEESLKGRIEVRNLGFRYSAVDDPVFSGLNFVIEPGETVAITGPSGTGKTTLLKCLIGLLTPTEGEILVDGQALSKLPHYRSQISCILQDDKLLSGSVADNIACFAPQVDMERVITCARQACVHQEITRMPMQYNTLVGDMGSSLSGGQYQRVVLARALYRAPKILYMDEATSHLDLDNEAAINHHISNLSITRIIVAHRPQTADSADRKISMRGTQ